MAHSSPGGLNWQAVPSKKTDPVSAATKTALWQHPIAQAAAAAHPARPAGKRGPVASACCAAPPAQPGGHHPCCHHSAGPGSDHHQPHQCRHCRQRHQRIPSSAQQRGGGSERGCPAVLRLPAASSGVAAAAGHLHQVRNTSFVEAMTATKLQDRPAKRQSRLAKPLPCRAACPHWPPPPLLPCSARIAAHLSAPLAGVRRACKAVAWPLRRPAASFFAKFQVISCRALGLPAPCWLSGFERLGLSRRPGRPPAKKRNAAKCNTNVAEAEALLSQTCIPTELMITPNHCAHVCYRQEL